MGLFCVMFIPDNCTDDRDDDDDQPNNQPDEHHNQASLSLRCVSNGYGVIPSKTIINKFYVYRSNISLWLERWFLSSNAKDIGILYLIFALLAGLVGTAFSVLIRLELSAPGVQYISDSQLYNSIITAHAIVMIFFMVI